MGHMKMKGKNYQNEKCNCATDNHYNYQLTKLLELISRKLLNADKYKRGLITAEKFNDVLNEMDLKFGSYEVDLLMRYCFVTSDGYVHFKNLLMNFHNLYTYDKLRDNVKESLCHPDILDQSKFDTKQFLNEANKKNEKKDDCALKLTTLTKEKSDTLRRIYAQWDRGELKDPQFFQCLNALEIPLTNEFMKSLSIYGSSRTLSFAKFIKSLFGHGPIYKNNQNSSNYDMISNCSNPFSVVETSQFSNFAEIKCDCCYDVKRNPITWGNTYESQLSECNYDFEEFVKKNCEKNNLSEKILREIFLRRLVHDYLTNIIPSQYFRLKLNQMVKIIDELDLLIRNNDADNKGSFQEFLKHITLRN